MRTVGTVISSEQPAAAAYSGGQRVRSSLFGLLGCNEAAAKAVTMRLLVLKQVKGGNQDE